MITRTPIAVVLLVVVAVAGWELPRLPPPLPGGGMQAPAPLDVRLPLQNNSVRFAVIGDSGTGDQQQLDVARQMERYREATHFDFVIMLGDNIYGGHRADDFQRKFEEPYAPLLAAGVKFYAALGNHDDSTVERLYKPFNMDGRRYYDYKRGNVTFFALDSDYMDPPQLSWLTAELTNTGTPWKIAYFHHPLYSDGKFHGPDLDLRKLLVPIFEQAGVNAVFSGHDHVYERFHPQDGIYYFLEGGSGQLRFGNLRGSPQRASGFDTDRSFMLVEIAGDELYFETIARTGAVVDSGSMPRQKPPAPAKPLASR